jgi:hypothetical protein
MNLLVAGFFVSAAVFSGSYKSIRTAEHPVLVHPKLL